MRPSASRTARRAAKSVLCEATVLPRGKIARSRFPFLLRCGDCIAIEKRPEDGLLAGLWQFPNVPDHLDETAALAEAKRRGVTAKALVSRVSRSHIFTHVKWDMRAYCIDCESRSPEFVWVDFPTLERDYALPSAFSQFFDVIKKQEA